MIFYQPEDSKDEVAAMGDNVATLQVIPSIWGHKGR